MWRSLWKIHKLLEYLWLILLLFPSLLKGQDFLWQVDPIPGRYTQVLSQSQSGLMLVGTDQGLFYYDGIEWDAILRPDSLQVTPTALFEENDTLWVGYEDGMLSYVSRGKAYFPDWEEGFPRVAITGIERDSTGVFWFSTYGEGVYYLFNERLYNIDAEDGLLDNDIYCIEQSEAGEMWVGTDRGISICSLEEGKKSLKNLTTDEGLPDYIVKSMASAPNGTMLVGMDEKGICFFNPLDSIFSSPNEMLEWEGGSINSVYIDRQRICIGTEMGDLWEMKGQGLRKLHSFSVPVKSLAVDQEGNLWCGLESSAIHRAPTSLISWVEVPQPIQAVYPGKSNGIWLGTGSGLWQFDQKNASLKQIPISPLNILSLYEDPQETLWIGTFGGGLWRYFPKGGQILHLSEKEGLGNNNILSMRGTKNDIWLATLGGVSHFQIPEDTHIPQFQNFDREEGLGTEYTYQVLEDSRGKVWIATDGKGLWYQQGNKFEQVPKVRQQTIYGLTEDAEQRVWFHTDGEGLWGLDGDSLIQFTLSSGLGSLQILGIQAIDDGSILLLNDQGMDLVDPQSQQVRSTILTNDIPDWEPNLNALQKAKDGSVWMGSRHRLFQYSPSLFPQQARPRPILKEVSVYLEPVEVDQLIQLSHKENHLSFSYSGIWYRSPKALRYRYRMVGVDLDWQVTQSTRATYPKLSPGTYTFELQVSSTENFLHADLLRIPLHIRKPFWQTWWFILLSMGVFIGILYKMIQAREKRLRQKEDVKRKQVKFQLETLQSQINPHFLFNSFNTLVSLIEEDKINAVDYVERLSDFFRNILELKDKSFISLKEELDLLKNYQEIQQSRYGKNFVLDLKIPSTFHQKIIPPLSLQLLVENALKHNVASEQQPLTVEIFTDQNTLNVRNNLQPKRGDLPSTQLGLKNIVKRFELLGSQSIDVKDGPDFFHVMLPLIDPLPHENPHY